MLWCCFRNRSEPSSSSPWPSEHHLRKTTRSAASPNSPILTVQSRSVAQKTFTGEFFFFTSIHTLTQCRQSYKLYTHAYCVAQWLNQPHDLSDVIKWQSLPLCNKRCATFMTQAILITKYMFIHPQNIKQVFRDPVDLFLVQIVILREDAIIKNGQSTVSWHHTLVKLNTRHQFAHVLFFKTTPSLGQILVKIQWYKLETPPLFLEKGDFISTQ